jgi:hypothetical protein
VVSIFLEVIFMTVAFSRFQSRRSWQCQVRAKRAASLLLRQSRISLWLSSFLLLSMFSLDAFAQVKIRERVEIEPIQYPTDILSEFCSPCDGYCISSGDTYRGMYWYGTNAVLDLSTVRQWPIVTGSVMEGAQHVRLMLNRDPDPLGGQVNGTSFFYRPGWGFWVIATFDQAVPSDSAVVRFRFFNPDTSVHPPFNESFAEIYVWNHRATHLRANAAPFPLPFGLGFYFDAEALDKCGDNFPLTSGEQYVVAITSGARYGRVWNQATGEIGTTLNVVPLSNGRMPTLVFAYDGEYPDSVGQVHIEIRTSSGHLAPVGVDATVLAPAPCALVSLTPSQLAPGDTAVIRVQKKDHLGRIRDYPADQKFFAYMLWGEEQYGRLLDQTQEHTGNALDSTRQPFFFIAADSMDVDSVLLHFFAFPLDPYPTTSLQEFRRASHDRREAVEETDASQENGKKNAQHVKKESRGERREFSLTEFECPIGSVVVKKGNDILLGETKYYQAKEDPNGNLEIIEHTSVPAQGSLSGVVWTVEKVEGLRLGVYHEDRDKDGNVLPGDDRIRLVGRYWTPDTTFKVRLTATQAGRSKSIEIEVKKPASLLSTNQDWSYALANNVASADIEISIDSLCIRFGGENGIPPQLLKGQMFQESYKSEGHRLWPSYRYEPWQDLRFRNGIYAQDYFAQPYWVDENGMGTSSNGQPVPTHHFNVKPRLSFSTSYPTTPTRIGDYVSDNLGQYYRGQGLRRNFISGHGAPSVVQVLWDNLVRVYKGSVPDGEAVTLVEEDFKSFLRVRYFEFWAQTRKTASYGFSQMLYTTAIQQKVGYPRSNANSPAPEELSRENILLPLVCKFLKSNVNAALKKLLSSEAFTDASWQIGFEETWRVSYSLYNSVPDYARSVINNSLRFLPHR